MKTVALKPLMDKLSTLTAAELIAAGGVRTCAGLNPKLHIYTEWSNETWNGIFFSCGYSNTNAKALDPSFSGPQFHAVAALRIAAAFYKVFGANSPLVRPMFAGFVMIPNISEQQLKMVANTTYNPEKIKPYGISIAPYYDNGNLGAITAGTDGNILAHSRLAKGAGVKFLCYEGGANAKAGNGPELYAQYVGYLKGLEKMGVEEFCNEGYEGAAGWGSKDFVGQPLDQAHKYRALLEAAKKNNPPPVAPTERQPVRDTVPAPAASATTNRSGEKPIWRAP